MDSDKLATALDTAWVKQKGQSTKLKVMAQINTSGEEGWCIDWLYKLKKHFASCFTPLLSLSVSIFVDIAVHLHIYFNIICQQIE